MRWRQRVDTVNLHLHVLANLLRHRDLQLAFGYLAEEIWTGLQGLPPSRLRGYRGFILVGLLFLGAGAVLVLRIVPLAELVEVAAAGSLDQRLSEARLVTAFLTLMLAVVGTTIALGQIGRALAQPTLRLCLAGLSTYHLERFTPRSRGTPDQPWKCCEVPIRILNRSEVIAHHLKVRLILEQLDPFLVDVHSAGVRAGRWTPRRELPGTQWEFRSDESFRVYAHDLAVLGHLRFTLPPDIAEEHGARFPSPHVLSIRAFVYDESGIRQQLLGLGLQPTP